jgi:hypothetical protein
MAGPGAARQRGRQEYGGVRSVTGFWVGLRKAQPGTPVQLPSATSSRTVGDGQNTSGFSKHHSGVSFRLS